MSKGYKIQGSKIFSANGGVASTIETIDNLSFQVLPFDEWNVYKSLNDHRVFTSAAHLLFEEPRLCARIRMMGFDKLEHFFQLEKFDDNVYLNCIPPFIENRTINAQLFPYWFYCPKCRRFMDIADWITEWETCDPSTTFGAIPKCPHCGGKVKGKTHLVQVRFVLVSMETGNVRDVPWDKVFDMKKNSKRPRIWEMDDKTKACKKVEYCVSKSSSNLFNIGVRGDGTETITMAEIMNHYFVIEENGKNVVYKPVIRNANNVYYAYNLNSVFVPKNEITETQVNTIEKLYNKGMTDPNDIKDIVDGISISEIQSVIDNGFKIPDSLIYDSEEAFRLEELEYITDESRYIDNNLLVDKLTSSIYEYTPKNRISKIFYQKHLCVTTTQIAYSRIDKIGLSNLSAWKGYGDPPKSWLDLADDYEITNSVPVQLRPTCNEPKNVKYMPAMQSFGEGFLVELNLEDIAKGERETYLHTYCHIIMKELEFSCGYSVASLCERLYFLPDKNRYAFMIYAVGGSDGGYGGITSLFYSRKIDSIIEMALERVKDCPNDPICEKEKGHCFACLDLPETACENFNTKLSRRVFNSY